MSTADHAAQARDFDAQSYTVEIAGGHAQLCSSRALTHAVLALVEEQQRTANLIAEQQLGCAVCAAFREEERRHLVPPGYYGDLGPAVTQVRGTLLCGAHAWEAMRANTETHRVVYG